MRQMYYDNLMRVYEKYGMDVKNFNCPNKDTLCKGLNNGRFARGMQCHLGYHYGEKPRVLVVSLDCGGGGSDNIQERTNKVLSNHHNPHMLGTISMLKQYYQSSNDVEVLNYFAMTNSCKCCSKLSKNQMEWKYFNACKNIKLEEIIALDPQIIFFQGKNAPVGCKFKEIDGIPNEFKDRLQMLEIGEKKYISVKCYHPRYYNRLGTTGKEKYLNLLNQIIDYLRTLNIA